MIISPILPQIGDDLDIADAVLGTLVTAYSLMVGLFAILSGPVSDRIGRRRILLAGCGVMTVALASHGLVDSYWSFLGVRVFAGMAGGVLSGAAVSYIGDYFPYDRRGWALGGGMSGAAFGQIIGIPMGIVMAERWGFHSPFYLFAITMALTLPLLFFGVPQPPVKRTSERLTVSGAFADYVTLLKRPEVAWAAVAYFVMFFGVAVFVIYLPTWLERDLGASGDQIALMFLVGGIANVVTGPQAGKLSDRIGRKGIILLSCIGLSVLMLGTVPLVTNITIAYVFFFLTMVLVAMRVSPFSALLTGLVRDERRGSLMSLAVALGQLGFALGGAVSGPMFARVGYASNTVLGAVFVLGMGLVVWFFIPEPNLEAAPATAD